MTSRSLILLSCVALAGCAPTIPFHFAETAETLQKKEVGLTVAAGGGGAAVVGNNGTSGLSGCCGGGDVRVRVGLGRSMEIGGELSVVGSHNQQQTGQGTSGVGTAALAGKVSFKFAPLRWFALIAGVGGSGAFTLNEASGQVNRSPFYFGADIAGVFSTDPIARILRVYGGARFTFVVPAASDVLANAPTQGFIVPVGLSIAPADRMRLFVEGGLTGGFSETRINGQEFRTDFVGGYGLFAFAYRWSPR